MAGHGGGLQDADDGAFGDAVVDGAVGGGRNVGDFCRGRCWVQGHVCRRTRSKNVRLLNILGSGLSYITRLRREENRAWRMLPDEWRIRDVFPFTSPGHRKRARWLWPAPWR